MNLNEQVVSAVGQKRSRDEINQKYLWHHRLGHIREDRINKMKKDEILGSFNSKSYPVCESYLCKKMVMLSFVGYGEKAMELFALAHIDVQTRDGYIYFIIFIDDLSWYGYMYMMKYKSEIFKKFKKFRNEAEKQTGKSTRFFNLIEKVNTLVKNF